MKLYQKIILASAVAVPTLGASAYAVAATDTTVPHMNLAERIAQRFNLNSDEVKTFLDENRQMMREEHRAQVSEALKAAGLSESQVEALQSKREEMKTAMQTWLAENPNATREEIKAQRETLRSDFETWAQSNGIDLTKVQEALPMRGGHKHGQGDQLHM